jgi:5-(carboxyamino)imidazole ribonucleotide synthase
VTKVGIMGAGQLGLMLGQAGQSLDLEFAFLDPAADPPARTVGPVLRKAFDSKEGLAMLAGCDVVTYEFENVPASAVESLSREAPVFPPPAALHHAQDRLEEKQLFEALRIPVPAWRAVSSRRELDEAIGAIGLPLVLKARRMGYDGKGQVVLRQARDAEAAWADLGHRPLIAEQWVSFQREVSVFGARTQDGRTALYPITENEHHKGILHVSRAPVEDAAVAAEAAGYLHKLLTHLDYVGVLALELFVVGGSVLANEFAPRVHNSGHWTIEGSATSQFENHLRAILGRPLGDTSPFGYSGMINFIGALPADAAQFSRPGYYVHDYGKAPRPGRKLGHLTIVAADAELRDEELSKALKVLGN